MIPKVEKKLYFLDRDEKKLIIIPISRTGSRVVLRGVSIWYNTAFVSVRFTNQPQQFNDLVHEYATHCTNVSVIEPRTIRL